MTLHRCSPDETLKLQLRHWLHTSNWILHGESCHGGRLSIYVGLCVCVYVLSPPPRDAVKNIWELDILEVVISCATLSSPPFPEGWSCKAGESSPRKKGWQPGGLATVAREAASWGGARSCQDTRVHIHIQTTASSFVRCTHLNTLQDILIN